MFVDHHCHLDFPQFADDLDGIVARAEAAGVGTMVTISTRIRQFEQVKAVAERFDNVYCSVGTHPHNAHEELDITVEDIIKLSQHPKCVAIGEAGLDYHYDYSTPEAQAEGFRNHIAAARETGLPLEIHARDADADTMNILIEETAKGAFPAVLHCYTGGRELALKAIELGLYIGFTGVVTFKSAQSLRDIAAEIPLERLLIETDAPYLAPIPFRGETNEPSFVVHTAQILADVRGMALEDFAKATTDNFFKLYTKAKRPGAQGTAAA